jgi:hypothetical protein
MAGPVKLNFGTEIIVTARDEPLFGAHKRQKPPCGDRRTARDSLWICLDRKSHLTDKGSEFSDLGAFFRTSSCQS